MFFRFQDLISSIRLNISMHMFPFSPILPHGPDNARKCGILRWEPADWWNALSLSPPVGHPDWGTLGWTWGNIFWSMASTQCDNRIGVKLSQVKLSTNQYSEDGAVYTYNVACLSRNECYSINSWTHPHVPHSIFNIMCQSMAMIKPILFESNTNIETVSIKRQYLSKTSKPRHRLNTLYLGIKRRQLKVCEWHLPKCHYLTLASEAFVRNFPDNHGE